jgi:predicted O-methyltransferase YrrM
LRDLVTFRTVCAEGIPAETIKPLVLQKVFDGESPYLGFPPDLAKPYLKEKRIRGWGSTGSVFSRLLREVNPKTILELGTYLGASAIHMATTARSILNHEVLILCVDDFRGWPGFRDKFKFDLVNGDVQLLYQFMQNVKAMNLTESLIPLPFSTTSAMASLCDWGVSFDLVEVDAAHDFHSAWSDINMGFSLLRPGGVMFGHDYFTKLDHRGVGRAVDLFAKLKGLRVEPDGQHWILRGY